MESLIVLKVRNLETWANFKHIIAIETMKMTDDISEKD